MDWKRPLLIGIGWGLGTAVGLAVLVLGFLWYRSRPRPPKPWDTSAIEAEYDYLGTEGDKNTIVFYYTLENTTDFDYRVEDGHNIAVNGKLGREHSLSLFSGFERIDYPIAVPAKKRVRFAIHVDYPYPEKQKPKSDADERRKYKQAVEKYVVDELSNLDGFDLLDETNRYEIVFPAGWKHSAKQEGSH